MLNFSVLNGPLRPFQLLFPLQSPPRILNGPLRPGPCWTSSIKYTCSWIPIFHFCIGSWCIRPFLMSSQKVPWSSCKNKVSQIRVSHPSPNPWLISVSHIHGPIPSPKSVSQSTSHIRVPNYILSLFRVPFIGVSYFTSVLVHDVFGHFLCLHRRPLDQVTKIKCPKSVSHIRVRIRGSYPCLISMAQIRVPNPCPKRQRMQSAILKNNCECDI